MTNDQIVYPVLSDSKASSHYGVRKAPNPYASINHAGLDIAAARGSDIQSIQSGTVIYSGTSGPKIGYGTPNSGGRGYGNVLIIKNSDGTSWLYAHLETDSFNLSKGDIINVGDKIAGVGATGNSTGYHLHLQKLNGEITQKIEGHDSTSSLGVFPSELREGSMDPTQEILSATRPTEGSFSFNSVISLIDSTYDSIKDFFNSLTSDEQKAIIPLSNSNQSNSSQLNSNKSKLIINEISETAYQIRSGETFFEIADDLIQGGLINSRQEFIEMNSHIEDINRINSGDELIIPRKSQEIFIKQELKILLP